VLAAITFLVGSIAIFLGLARVGLAVGSSAAAGLAVLHVVLCVGVTLALEATARAPTAGPFGAAITADSATVVSESPLPRALNAAGPLSVEKPHPVEQQRPWGSKGPKTPARLVPRLLIVGAAAIALVALVLVGLVGAKGTNGELATVAAVSPRRMQGVGGSWMNVTVTQTVNTSVAITSYPGGERNVCLLFPNVTVPVASTSYLCRAFAVPPVPLHTLEFEMLLDATPYVHHAVVWLSDEDYSRPGSAPATPGYPPFTDLGAGVFDCLLSTPPNKGIAYAWAVGQGVFTFPPNTGLPIGSAGSRFVFVQMHYSNPSSMVNVKDSSGVLMRVTDARPAIDVGILWLGGLPVSIAGSIPANKAAYGLQHKITLPPGLPPAAAVNPLTTRYTAFANFLHMHLIGQKIWVETTRGGKRILDSSGLDQLGVNAKYDFSLQSNLAINGTLQAGDEVNVKCIFKNTPANGALVGNNISALGQAVVYGESTNDEMCMSFLYYYPRVPAVATQPATGMLQLSSVFCDAAGATPCPL
jgi:hypothetical protein